MTQRTEGAPIAPVGKSQRWWRRPWVAPLGVITVGFLAFSLPPYLTFDSSKTRLPLRDGFAVHYPLLLIHIFFGTVALVCCFFQIWPWFRKRYPVAHRRIGRTYFFAGVLPSGLAGVVVAVTAMQGVVGRAGNALLAIVWLAFTYAGYRMARQRRFGEHRRWMVRSFALTTSIVANRVWVAVWLVTLSPFTDSYYGGNEDAMAQAAAEAAIWMSWVVNLLIAEWWLERGRGKRRRVPTVPAESSQAVPARPTLAEAPR